MDTDIEDIAQALWYMFAFGNDAKRWDEKTRGAWMAKAERVIDLAIANRTKREAAE